MRINKFLIFIVFIALIFNVGNLIYNAEIKSEKLKLNSSTFTMDYSKEDPPATYFILHNKSNSSAYKIAKIFNKKLKQVGGKLTGPIYKSNYEDKNQIILHTSFLRTEEMMRILDNINEIEPLAIDMIGLHYKSTGKYAPKNRITLEADTNNQKSLSNDANILSERIKPIVEKSQYSIPIFRLGQNRILLDIQDYFFGIP